MKHPKPPTFGCASMAPLPVGQGSKEPARGGVLGVSSATSFFLEFTLKKACALQLRYFGAQRSQRLGRWLKALQSHDFQAKIGENPTTLSNWQRPGGSGGAQRLPIAQPSPLASTAVVRSRSEHTKHHLAHSPPRPAWWWPSCWFRRAGTRPRELFMEVTAMRQPSSYRTTTTTTMALECCKTDHSAMVFT